MNIALVGNPNSGKTTLFNRLTKLNQKIGNWPGVTVERKEGKYFNDKSINIIDLPGVYSLNPVSQDEKIAFNYLVEQKPDCVINVIDSGNLSRSLSLTLELIELDIPIVIALNMEDELKGNGITLDCQAMTSILKKEAVLISARKNKNIINLIDIAKVVVQKGTLKQEEFGHSNMILENIEKVSHESEAEVLPPTINDEQFNYSKITLLSPLSAIGLEYDIDSTPEQKYLARQEYVNKKIGIILTKSQSRLKSITDKIDKVVLNKYLSFPIFVGIIMLMYYVSVQIIGGVVTDGVVWFFEDLVGENFRDWLISIESAEWVSSLFVDGMISGVGAVFSFVPQIVVLFMFITFLEACGYMSRVAIIMDRIFRKFGLNGKSFIPMIIGCGCSVPAILGAKTVEDEKERKRTIMLIPFVPCSAKLPVFAMMAGVFFPDNPFVAPSMYFLGIFMVIVGGLILKLFDKQKTVNSPFILELPIYRLPKASNMCIEAWHKVKGYTIKAAIIILPATIIIWFLGSFNMSFAFVEIDESILASIGRAISFIYAPLGFNDWRISIGIISGFLAKETTVATFGVILGEVGFTEVLATLFTTHAAYGFMAFILLSAPCVAAVTATKKEMGSFVGMVVAVGFQCIIGYIVALVMNQFGNLWLYNKTTTISIIAVLIIVAIISLCVTSYIKNHKRNKGNKCAGCSGCSSNKCTK